MWPLSWTFRIRMLSHLIRCMSNPRGNCRKSLTCTILRTTQSSKTTIPRGVWWTDLWLIWSQNPKIFKYSTKICSKTKKGRCSSWKTMIKTIGLNIIERSKGTMLWKWSKLKNFICIHIYIWHDLVSLRRLSCLKSRSIVSWALQKKM